MPLKNLTVDFEPELQDGTGRLQVVNPQQVFEDRHNYNIGPALWETVDNTNGTVSHLSDEAGVSMSIPGASGDKITRQTYQHFHYTPGQLSKYELAALFPTADADLRTRVGAFTSDDGVFLEQNGTTLNAVIRSSTSGSAVETRTAQSSWNLDKLDGTGKSKLTLDMTKIQMVFFRFAWYGAGVVELGFRISGISVIAHRFPTANNLTAPWCKTGTLPFRYEIENTGATGTTSVLKTYGASVVTEGSRAVERGYLLEYEGTGTAASGTRSHICSIRPKTTFNGVENRTDWILESIDMLNTGNNPAKYEIGYGHTLTGASYADVNSTYSAYEATNAGTINTQPTLITQGGFVASNNKAGESLRTSSTENIIPLTLDAAGAVRNLGTIGVFATGISGATTVRVLLNWREII